jgi:mono/diheme cytochrome c family protein
VVTAVAVALALASATAASSVSAAAADDDAETLVQHCRACHTLDLVAQQRLTAAQWEKVVAKMRGWGTPLAEGDSRALASHLASRYTTATAAGPEARVTLARASAATRPASEPVRGDAARGQDLYRSACASCHGAHGEGGGAGSGPALVRRPVLVRPAEWREVVARGRRRMPAFEAMTRRDMTDILVWVRALPAPRRAPR